MNDILEPPDEPGPSGSAIEQETRPAGHLEASAVDIAVYSNFYRAHVRSLINFLLWMGASLSDASDLAQETMIDAYRSWPEITHPRAWIRRVASRKFAHQRFSPFDDAAADPADDGDPLLPVTSDIAAWEQRHEVLRLLATLPWRQRQVMAWSYDGYPPAEIAEELGISAETVRSNLKLARRGLAKQLDRGKDPK